MNGEGKYTVKENTECKHEVVPEPEDVYVIAGVEELLGEAWNATAEANKMTVKDGTATLVKEHLVLAAGSYGFKVVKNGSTWIPDGEGNESKLVIESAGTYTVTFTYVLGGEAATAEAKSEGEVPEPETVTVRFYADWAVVNAFAWGGSSFGDWPGKALTKGEDGWYAVEVAEGANLVFSGAEGKPQTVDIEKVAKDICYDLGDLNGEGKYTVKENTECKHGDEPQPEMVYTIVGDASLVGSNWDLNDKANEMVEADGAYTLVKEDVSLTAGEYKYKVVGNHSWEVFQLPLEGDNLLNIEEDGTYTVTFTFDGKENLGATAKKTSGEVVVKYYVAGTMNGWNPAGNELVDGKVVLHLEAATYQFKITKGDWKWEANFDNVDEECSTAKLFTEGSGKNIYFTIVKEQDVTIEYNAETEKICVKAETGEITEDVYVVAGQEALLGVDWDGSAEANKMTVKDGKATLVKEHVDLKAGTYTFKVVKNGSSWIPDGMGNDSELNIEADGVYTVTFTYVLGEEAASATAKLEGEVPLPVYVTVRFFDANWATVYIYAWGGSDFGAWPGKQMSKDESGWYAEKVLAGSNIIFNAGEGQAQTVDIENVEADLCYELGEANEEGKYAVVVNAACKLPTSLDNNEENATVLLIGNKLVVSIEGTANVSIFNMAGQMIDNQMATDSYTRSLASGIYLIRVDGQSYKAVIR